MSEHRRPKQYRSNPTTRVLIEGFLIKRKEASFGEIYGYVESQHVAFISKTPKNSVRSVMYRMENLECLGAGKYRLKPAKE